MRKALLTAWAVATAVAATGFVVLDLATRGVPPADWSEVPLWWLTVAWWAAWLVLLPTAVGALFSHAILFAFRAHRLHDYLLAGAILGAATGAVMPDILGERGLVVFLGACTGIASAVGFWRIARPDLSPKP